MPYIGNTTTSFNVDSNNINNGSITTEKIAAGAVVNADVNDSASIAGTKISADFGAQNLVVDTSLLFVDATNDRVGIGTSSPGTNLHIGGGSGTGLGVLLSRGAATNFFEAHDGTKTFIGGTDNTNAFVKVGSLSDHPVAIVQSNGSAIYIDSSKRVGIGTTSPSDLLHVSGGNILLSDGYDIKSPDNFAIYDTAGARDRFNFSTSNTYNTRSGGVHAFQINNSEAARIDSSGRLLVGTSSTRSDEFTGALPVLIETRKGGANGDSTNVVLATNFDGARGSSISFIKSHADELSSVALVSSQDILGSLNFSGTDGTNPVAAARIQAFVDGTPGANDMPGRLVFSTTADGASSPTERMRIANTGAFGLSGANYGTSGQVLTSQGSGSAPQWATPAEGLVDYGGTDANGISIINITGISLDCRLLKIYIMHFSSSNNNSPQISLRLGNGSVSSASYTGRVFESNSNGTEAIPGDRINITHTAHTANSHVWTGIIDVGMSVGSGCAVSWNIFSAVNHAEFGAARWNGNNRIDRIQLIGSAGNWDGGYVRVFGDR